MPVISKRGRVLSESTYNGIKIRMTNFVQSTVHAKLTVQLQCIFFLYNRVALKLWSLNFWTIAPIITPFLNCTLAELHWAMPKFWCFTTPKFPWGTSFILLASSWTTKLLIPQSFETCSLSLSVYRRTAYDLSLCREEQQCLDLPVEICFCVT